MNDFSALRQRNVFSDLCHLIAGNTNVQHSIELILRVNNMPAFDDQVVGLTHTWNGGQAKQIDEYIAHEMSFREQLNAGKERLHEPIRYSSYPIRVWEKKNFCLLG